MEKGCAIFGAGMIGKNVADILMYQGKQIDCFIDNHKNDGQYMDIPIISLEEWKEREKETTLVIACGKKNAEEIKQQLIASGIVDYKYYAELDLTDDRERVISYASEDELEDVVLYHVLKDEKDIFYIDVGCNDPFVLSVTKLIHDTRGGYGINIDPQKALIHYMNNERVNDINLCVGCGSCKGTTELYIQGTLSTTVVDNVVSKGVQKETVEIVTLKSICDQYVNQEISFLKIDVEGAEKEVLEGADFSNYRPWIIVMESTFPGTEIPNYGEWENILLMNHYHLAFVSKIERYYVADERRDLDSRFLDIKELKKIYKIYHADLNRMF